MTAARDELICSSRIAQTISSAGKELCIRISFEKSQRQKRFEGVDAASDTCNVTRLVLLLAVKRWLKLQPLFRLYDEQKAGLATAHAAAASMRALASASAEREGCKVDEEGGAP